MQRQRSAVSSIHDSTFHHGSASSDSSIDQERCLDSMRNSSEEQLSDCVIPSGSASRSYMNSANQEVHDLSGWSLGECSLSGAGDYVNKNIPMSVCTGTARISGDMQYESSNDLSRNNVTGSLHTEQATSGHLFMQTPFVPKDRINNLQFSGSDENGDDDCQIIECGSAIGSGISNKKLHGGSRSFQHYSRASSSGGYTLEDTDGRAGSSMNAKPLSRKAKTLEASASHSSGSGSSNLVPHVDRGSWQATRFPHNAGSGIPAPTGNIRKISLSDQSHAGLGLSIDEAASVVPLAISASSGRGESSRRNFQMGISSSHQQDCMPGIVSSTESVGGSSNVLSAHHSLRLTSISNSLDLGPFTVADNGCLQRPMINFVRNSRSRRHRGSSSRAGNSNTHISEDRSAMPDEAPPFRNVSRDILEHPVFIPATQIETSSQNPTTWSLANGNAGVFGRVGSSSRGGSSLGVNSHSSSLVPHRDSSQYPRRLSEFVRRSLITPRGTDQNNRYNPTYSGPSSSSPEQIRSSGHADQRQHRSRTRSAVLLERHLSRSLGVPYPSHSLTAASEGRNRLVSEIRNVLDLMRRGEGLRVEEVMILDQSVLFGMADLHDRHRDMRLDVDNMSYEELLALEERIGNVSTGLTEETISTRLQQKNYRSTKDQAVEDPCCICRDEYNDAETLGILECGHGFHSDCIKQWLMQKNICPICKTTGLNT